MCQQYAPDLLKSAVHEYTPEDIGLGWIDLQPVMLLDYRNRPIVKTVFSISSQHNITRQLKYMHKLIITVAAGWTPSVTTHSSNCKQKNLRPSNHIRLD